MKMRTKRLTILLAVTALLLSCVPVASAQGGTYMVVPYSTPMLATPEAQGSFICDVYKGTILSVTDVRNGYGYIYRNSLACGGWVSMEDLEQLDGDSYNADTVTGLMIMPPVKVVYIRGEEEFDDTGMSVWAVFADGTKKQIEGYALYLPSFDTVGEKTIYISYKPENSTKTFSVSFHVTVLQVPVHKMMAEGSMKTDYVQGQKLSLDGLLLRVTYLDSRPDAVFTAEEILAPDSGFELTDCCGELTGTPLTTGSHSITLRYLTDSCSTVIPITVLPSTPQRLEVLALPYNTTMFSDTKKPDLAGLLVAVHYDNGTVEYLNHTECTYSFDEENAVLGSNDITVSCRGLQTSISVTMVEPALIGIEVAACEKTVYALQEDFAFEKLSVNGLYESGMKHPVYGWTLAGYDKTLCGKQTLTVRLESFTDTLDAYVTIHGVLPGDADLDETITAADARLILRCSVGLTELTGAALFAADRTQDGEIEAADARSTLRAAVKLEPIYVAAAEQ